LILEPIKKNKLLLFSPPPDKKYSAKMQVLSLKNDMSRDSTLQVSHVMAFCTSKLNYNRTIEMTWTLWLVGAVTKPSICIKFWC